MRTKQNQQDVEDTRSLNRQSRVEHDFRAFPSDERIDACIIIQKRFKEKTDISAKRLSSMMFEVGILYLTMRLRARDFYEAIVDQANTESTITS